MSKVKKICRICGKEYTPCGYCEHDKMAFHYRTICCSRECAEVYLKRVLDARSPKDESTAVTSQEATDVKPKRKYTKKKQTKIDSEDGTEQIENSDSTQK